jgi:hypothetical protein
MKYTKERVIELLEIQKSSGDCSGMRNWNLCKNSVWNPLNHQNCPLYGYFSLRMLGSCTDSRVLKIANKLLERIEKKYPVLYFEVLLLML